MKRARCLAKRGRSAQTSRRMKSLAFLLALFVAFVAPIRAEDYEARTFTADGKSLPYRLLKPQDYDASKKYPLVLFLHGAGERGDDNSAQLKHGAPAFLKPEVRAKFPAFVVAPQCPREQKWADVDWSKPVITQPAEASAPAKLALGAIDALQKEFSIDADRIYITGLSMGGYGTWDLITRYPEKWAAAVPICGGGDPTVVARAKSIPVWAFHGAVDNVVPTVQTRNLVAALKAAGAAPLYSEYPGTAHDSWTAAYQEPELFPWLFAQRRGQPAVPFEKTAAPFAQPPSESFPATGPTQPGIWFRGLWKGRRTEWSKATANDQGAVVFFGDSITQGWGTLAQDFPKLKVANRGISGDTTRGLLLRIQGDVLDVHPRAVSLLIGTNDLALGATPQVVASNIREIVAQLHKADAKMPVVINKVMPRALQPGTFPDKIRELNGLLDEAFKGDALVSFCDTWTLFADENGSCKKEEFPDMLHPNGAGYAKWTAALTPIFEKLQLAQ